jgi:TolB-like protein
VPGTFFRSTYQNESLYSTTRKGAWHLFFLALAGCATFGSGSVHLDEAVQLSAKELEAAFPDGVKIAVFSFKSDSGRLSDYVIEELMGALVKGRKVVVVDRNSLDLVRQEWNFQSSGEVGDEFDEIGNCAKGTVTVRGNSVTGTLRHMWGNAFSEGLGGYWVALKDFFKEIGNAGESEIAPLMVWHAEMKNLGASSEVSSFARNWDCMACSIPR